MSYPPILVIEDSHEDFDTVVEAARRLNLKNSLVRANDAGEALQILSSGHCHNQTPFSLMILDYNLPGKNGCDFLKDYAGMAGEVRVPVVVYTSSTNLVDCRECYRAGASAYHAKSVNYRESLKTLEGIFKYWLGSVMLPPASPPSS